MPWPMADLCNKAYCNDTQRHPHIYALHFHSNPIFKMAAAAMALFSMQRSKRKLAMSLFRCGTI